MQLIRNDRCSRGPFVLDLCSKRAQSDDLVKLESEVSYDFLPLKIVLYCLQRWLIFW